MSTDKTVNIRDILNHPWKKLVLFQDLIKWDKTWASLDTLEDTEEAIKYYLSLTDFGPFNGGYLFVYGILQALILQQDALNNLVFALFGEKIDLKNKYPELYKIREHRNNSIGHPTKRGNDNSFHMIGRHSISKKGFALLSYYPNTGEETKLEDICILECIESQEKLLNKILSKTMDELKNELNKHKSKFKGDKIKDKIPNSFDYHVSKLYEHIYRDYPNVKMDFKIVNETFQNIKIEVERRYFKVDALNGLDHTIKILEYIINRLENTLIDNKIQDEYELLIFIDALKQNSKELFEMVEEIDKDFGYI